MEEEQPLGSSASSSGTDTPAKPRDQPAELLPVNYEIFAVGTDEKIEPYLVFVDVSGTTLQMEIDTGSALTLISQETFSKLWPQGGPPQLEKTSLCLRTYSGEELKVIGRAAVRVGCGGQVVEDLGLVVVGGKGPNLFGGIGWGSCGWIGGRFERFNSSMRHSARYPRRERFERLRHSCHQHPYSHTTTPGNHWFCRVMPLIIEWVLCYLTTWTIRATDRSPTHYEHYLQPNESTCSSTKKPRVLY